MDALTHAIEAYVDKEMQPFVHFLDDLPGDLAAASFELQRFGAQQHQGREQGGVFILGRGGKLGVDQVQGLAAAPGRQHAAADVEQQLRSGAGLGGGPVQEAVEMDGQRLALGGIIDKQGF